jgi:bacterioferritin-associated ferredoxin
MRQIRIYNQSLLLFIARLHQDANMIVCVCHRVSDREIARHARAGLSFDDIQLELGVATQCGRCEDCARDVVAQCSAAHPVAALNRDDQHHAIQLDGSIAQSRGWRQTAAEATSS